MTRDDARRISGPVVQALLWGALVFLILLACWPASASDGPHELRDRLSWDTYTDPRGELIHIYYRDVAAVGWTLQGTVAPAVDGPTAFASLLTLATTSPCTETTVRFIARAADAEGNESGDSDEATALWTLWTGETRRSLLWCSTGADPCVPLVGLPCYEAPGFGTLTYDESADSEAPLLDGCVCTDGQVQP